MLTADQGELTYTEPSIHIPTGTSPAERLLWREAETGMACLVSGKDIQWRHDQSGQKSIRRISDAGKRSRKHFGWECRMRISTILISIFLFAGISRSADDIPMWELHNDWICASNKMHECVIDSDCRAIGTSAVWKIIFKEGILEYLNIEYTEKILYRQEKYILYYSNDLFLSSGRVLTLRPGTRENKNHIKGVGGWEGYSTEGTSNSVTLREWQCAPSR